MKRRLYRLAVGGVLAWSLIGYLRFIYELNFGDFISRIIPVGVEG